MRVWLTIRLATFPNLFLAATGVAAPGRCRVRVDDDFGQQCEHAVRLEDPV